MFVTTVRHNKKQMMFYLIGLILFGVFKPLSGILSTHVLVLKWSPSDRSWTRSHCCHSTLVWSCCGVGSVCLWRHRVQESRRHASLGCEQQTSSKLSSSLLHCSLRLQAFLWLLSFKSLLFLSFPSSTLFFHLCLSVLRYSSFNSAWLWISSLHFFRYSLFLSFSSTDGC